MLVTYLCVVGWYALEYLLEELKHLESKCGQVGFSHLLIALIRANSVLGLHGGEAGSCEFKFCFEFFKFFG